MKNARGFTIVELLIVIVVIGILAAMSIVAYNNVTSKARDSQRVQDITSITKALEMYYLENGEYPRGQGSTDINNSWSATSDGSWQYLADRLAPYASGIPSDPINDGQAYSVSSPGHYGYGYAYFAGSYCGAVGLRQMYILAYRMESGELRRETIGNCSSNFLNGASSYTRAIH